MSFSDCFDATLCVRLMQTLGHFIWQGASVFLFLWLGMFLMRRSSPNARYFVSLSALLLMVLCPAVTFIWIGHQEAVPNITTLSSHDVLVMPDSEILIAPIAEPPAIAERSALHIDWQQYAPSVAMGYMLGVVIMLCRVLMALQGGRRLRYRSEPVDDTRILVALVRQTKALGLSYTPAIGYCRDIVVPTVIGVLRPMILLPISVSTGLNAEQIEALLAHELAHIRRYDHLVNIFQRVIEAILFFHPCVWLISRRIRIERENGCDDMVVAGGIKDTTYADTLCQMAEIILTSDSGRSLAAVAAIGAANSSTELQQRILRVIKSPACTPVRLASGRHAALILMALATALAAYQLTASAKLESISNLEPKPIADGKVYILGQVMQQGAYPISEGEELTLMQLITTAGVYDGEEIEDATVMLSRYGADGKRHIISKLMLTTLSENAGNDVSLRHGDLVTLSSEPLYRPRRCNNLVVGTDHMTFEGQDATWDTLPALLQAVPNRQYMLLSVYKAEGNVPTTEQFEAALRKADEFVDEYGFQARLLGGLSPLGTKSCYTHYVQIEEMHEDSGEVIPIDEDLFQAHITDPPGRPRYHVRLVVGADRMTFQGQDATWDTLPAMLEAVPNRKHTAVEISRASDSPPGDNFQGAVARLDELQRKFGFEGMYPFLPGLRPLGAMGSPTLYIDN